MPKLKNKLLREHHYLVSALMFYTRLPMPRNAEHSAQILNRSRKYFPLVGILVGAIGALVFYLGHIVFEHSLAIALSMVATILLTGAFHEDGLADSCDGLGGGWTIEQVLTIMKDSRIGTYGVVGLLSVLTIKLLSLVSLSNQAIALFSICYICAHSTSRAVSSMTIERYNYVQDIDLSKVKPITDRRLGQRDLMFSALIALVPILILGAMELQATLVACLCALAIASVFARYCHRRIGGYTGDILGAIQQLAEIAFYLGFIATLSVSR